MWLISQASFLCYFFGNSRLLLRNCNPYGQHRYEAITTFNVFRSLAIFWLRQKYFLTDIKKGPSFMSQWNWRVVNIVIAFPAFMWVHLWLRYFLLYIGVYQSTCLYDYGAVWYDMPFMIQILQHHNVSNNDGKLCVCTWLLLLMLRTPHIVFYWSSQFLLRIIPFLSNGCKSQFGQKWMSYAFLLRGHPSCISFYFSKDQKKYITLTMFFGSVVVKCVLNVATFNEISTFLLIQLTQFKSLSVVESVISVRIRQLTFQHRSWITKVKNQKSVDFFLFSIFAKIHSIFRSSIDIFHAF